MMTKTNGPAEAGATANWQRLVEWEQPALYRGTVFRCMKAAWPYENVVDFLLIEHMDSFSRLALFVSTGYKAGLLVNHLPAEALIAKDVRALSKAWLLGNWSEWVYGECPVESVWGIKSYPSQVRVEGTPPEPSRDLKIA